LQLPRPQGFGVEPWDGVTTAMGHVSTARLEGLNIVNSTGFTTRRLARYYGLFFPVTQHEAGQLAKVELARRMATDDIPAVNTILRRGVDKPMWSRIARAKKFVLPAGVNRTVLQQQMRLAELPAHEDSLTDSQDVGQSYGIWPQLKQLWVDIYQVLSLRKESTYQYFQKIEPVFCRDLARLEKKGLSRSEALSWLWGDPVVQPLVYIHPSLSRVLSKALALCLSACLSATTKILFASVVSTVAPHLEGSLYRSPLQQVLYMY
jgi:hypothetical protein